MARRRRVLPLLACLAVSLAVHATWVGGTWWLVPFVPVSVEAQAKRVKAEPRRELPPLPEDPFRLGSGGEGRAVLDSVGEEPQVAEEWLQDQPWLEVAGGQAGGSSAQRRQIEVAEALQIEPTRLDRGPPASQLAGLLTPPEPEPPEADDEMEATDEGEAVASAGESELPPSQRADDRDSQATSEQPETLVDARSGEVISREGVDFKLVGLRVGLAALMDGSFLPPGSRVQFQIVVDESGVPLEVAIVQSSGSSAVDAEIRKIVFNSWFGAPPHEPFPFGIVLRK